MGKGRSEKPAFEQYKGEIEKKTYRYTPESAYKGAQFQNRLFGANSSLLTIGASFYRENSAILIL